MWLHCEVRHDHGGGPINASDLDDIEKIEDSLMYSVITWDGNLDDPEFLYLKEALAAVCRYLDTYYQHHEESI